MRRRRVPFVLLALPLSWLACFSSGSSGSGGGADFDSGEPDATFPDGPGEEGGPDVSSMPDTSTEMTPPPQDASVDSPPRNEAGKEAGMLAVTITVFGATGPEQGVTIVYGDATGAVVGTPATTDAAGMVTQLLPAGATMITALLGNASSPSPYTVMGVQEGDGIFVPDFGSLTTYAQGSVQVTDVPASPPANTVAYNAFIGSCDNQGTPPIFVGLSSGTAGLGCIGLGSFGGGFGAAIPLLVEATDATDNNVFGFTFQKNNSFATFDAGVDLLNISLSGGTWSTSFTTQTLAVANLPSSTVANLQGSESANDVLHLLPLNYVTTDAGSVAQVTTHVGYGDTFQAEAWSSSNYQWYAATATSVAPPTADGTVTIDATPLGTLPQITATNTDVTTPERPALTWTLAQGTFASTTGLIGNIQWSAFDDAGAAINGNWTIVAPSSATSLQAPALPASASAYQPPAGATFMNMLQGLVGTAVPSYQQLRSVGPVIGAHENAGCVSTPVVPYLPSGTLSISVFTSSGCG